MGLRVCQLYIYRIFQSCLTSYKSVYIILSSVKVAFHTFHSLIFLSCMSVVRLMQLCTSTVVIQTTPPPSVPYKTVTIKKYFLHLFK